MITEDMKKAIQNEVKKQLGVLKEKDGTEKKVLTPYQKTIKLLKSYRYYKNRIEYLKNNFYQHEQVKLIKDEVDLAVSQGEISATRAMEKLIRVYEDNQA